MTENEKICEKCHSQYNRFYHICMNKSNNLSLYSIGNTYKIFFKMINSHMIHHSKASK